MPDAPEENNENDSFQVPPGKSNADCDQKDRRENKTPTKPFEERTVTVGPDHSREMVPCGAEGGHEKVNVLRAPARLCQSEHRHQ
jgi:hypothetical protein